MLCNALFKIPKSFVTKLHINFEKQSTQKKKTKTKIGLISPKNIQWEYRYPLPISVVGSCYHDGVMSRGAIWIKKLPWKTRKFIMRMSNNTNKYEKSFFSFFFIASPRNENMKYVKNGDEQNRKRLKLNLVGGLISCSTTAPVINGTQFLLRYRFASFCFLSLSVVTPTTRMQFNPNCIAM